MTSFRDTDLVWHTLALTETGAYYTDTAGTLHAPLSFHSLAMPTYVNTVTLNAAGTGYVVGDEMTLQQPPAQGCILQVTGIDGSGGVTSFTMLSRGSDYHNASGVSTTSTGNGTGATFDIVTGSIASLNGTRLPYGVVKANSRVYFCNGSTPLLYTDGEANLKISGSVPGNPRYLTVNDSHLIGAYWTELDSTFANPIDYPVRVRWSTAGDFDQWDTGNPSSTAGVADLFQIPDQITGLTTLGNNSYIYRDNGVSIMQRTGQASLPFDIFDYSIAPKSEGNTQPYSLVTHNNVDRFIGTSEVWAFDGTNFSPLMEGKCNDMFFHQLSLVSGGPVRGMVSRVLDNDYTYLAYIISLPGLNTAWALNISEGSWTVWQWQPPPGSTSGSGSYDLQLIEQVYF
jgi:hypothetical protein